MPQPKITMKDYEHMVSIERAVLDALKPYRNGQTEACLVAMALIRVARQLLYMYPLDIIKQLTPLFVAFIKGDKKQPGANASPLWMPPTIN